MNSHPIDGRHLLDARLKAFSAIKLFLLNHAPIDSDAKRAELDRLRVQAEAAVLALNESAAA
ncbi:hypothetical protein IB229_06145 [Pseudomonas sp. PDM14]|uniref:hypothetical protein n=1 Tax=Pseudomonas sp. PDM14 TaxID=2769288 RepID=UPI00178498F0|nr:hypothetical protein [Pseudomonas sp. PDM14]MBD9482540.1 hypothetical protein [Pseudomonas sp. PDM14]